MHLPDGFLDPKTAVLTTAAATAGVGVAVRHARATLTPRQVPLLGLSAAFVFAAQMLNFPVAGGTSGHLIGGVLTAVLLGPSAAVIVIACVLIVQCLMFADGGLLALGANTFNMALVSVGSGYFVFRVVRLLGGAELRSTVAAAGFAGWCGTVMASIFCAGQLALSGTVPWALAFPAMANIHMLIGIGEGLATALIVLAVLRVRPELLAPAAVPVPPTRWTYAAYGLLISLGLAVFVAPFASPWPDGLEHVAEKLGFLHRAGDPLLQTPFADYQAPFAKSAILATSLAGFFGTLIVFVAAWGLARVLVPPFPASPKNAPAGR
jgi:cobalt/nickel transport system permease protein